jgi:O-antigen ligase
MNPSAPLWPPWRQWPRDREGLRRAADLVLEYGVYLYLFALFRATGLRMALTMVLLLAGLIRLALDPALLRRLAAEPVLRALALFLLLVLVSVAYSPRPGEALAEFVLTLGTAGWLAVIVPCALREETHLERLLIAALLVALYLNFVQIKGIVLEYQKTGRLLADVGLHRPHSISLMFFTPFLLGLAERARRGWRAIALWAAVALQFLLLLATVGRAAMLAMAVAMAIWLLVRRPWRLLVVGSVVLVLGAGALWLLPSDSAHWQYLHKGFSSGERMDLTWGPTMAMIARSPWFGYGYGEFVYPQVFDALIPAVAFLGGPPIDYIRALGPHNYYLEIWFQAGLLALAAMIWLFARVAAQLYELVRATRADDLVGLTALAALGAFTAHYLVHAHFGTLGPTGLRPLGILIGLGVALRWMRALEHRASPT